MKYNEQDKDEIAGLLLGQRVEKVSEDRLVLANGTELTFVGNDGGCSCGAGDYQLTTLNGVDNVITSVEFEDNPTDDSGHEDEEGWYKIFVFAGHERINLATFEGSDGNGWYGTGYQIHVRQPEVP